MLGYILIAKVVKRRKGEVRAKRKGRKKEKEERKEGRKEGRRKDMEDIKDKHNNITQEK